MKASTELIIFLLVAGFALLGLLLTTQLTGQSHFGFAVFPVFKDTTLNVPQLISQVRQNVLKESQQLKSYKPTAPEPEPEPTGCCECGDLKADDLTRATCTNMCPEKAKFSEGKACKELTTKKPEKEKPEVMAGVYFAEQRTMLTQEELPFREYVISGPGATRGYTKKSPFGPAPPPPPGGAHPLPDTRGMGMTGFKGEPTVDVATLCRGATGNSKWSCAAFKDTPGCWDSGLMDAKKQYTCQCKPNTAGTYPNCGAATLRFEIEVNPNIYN
ncbi:hypothetical protein HYV79_02855 [Candidatus Woesearchaeota archaeon]|nr:hypothetical protein [Candidatus Woesearchaeota archaeon]